MQGWVNPTSCGSRMAINFIIWDSPVRKGNVFSTIYVSTQSCIYLSIDSSIFIAELGLWPIELASWHALFFQFADNRLPICFTVTLLISLPELKYVFVVVWFGWGFAGVVLSFSQAMAMESSTKPYFQHSQMFELYSKPPYHFCCV